MRAETEDLLKQGRIPAIVATALELGIDMGAVELVVQVSAPPSVSSALQRVGRAQHHVGGIPKGVTFLSSPANWRLCNRCLCDGCRSIEATRYPRNLDILAQHLVASVAMNDWTVDDIFDLCRQAAPFHELGGTFERSRYAQRRYPSDEFAELRPRLNWDRINGALIARPGARELPSSMEERFGPRSRCLLADGLEGTSRRVGELDEEMVFESRIGDVFLLGASSWRVEDITPEKVSSPPPENPENAVLAW